QFVVAEALRKAHTPAVAEFAQQREHLPLHLRRGALGRIAEINLVLNLQPAQLRVEHAQFFVDGHPGFSKDSLGVSRLRNEIPVGHKRDGTKVPKGGYQLSAISYELSALSRHPSAKPPGLLVPPPLRCHPERSRGTCFVLRLGTRHRNR